MSPKPVGMGEQTLGCLCWRPDGSRGLARKAREEVSGLGDLVVVSTPN